MQENTYIEELARLISATVADMNRMSSKPDKTEILQKTVDQIRTIREQEGNSTSDAVQQGEVSSSKPTILPNEVFGPLLLEVRTTLQKTHSLGGQDAILSPLFEEVCILLVF